MLDHLLYQTKLDMGCLNMKFRLYETPVYKDWFGTISVGQLLIPAEPILTPKFGYVYQLSDLILLNTKYTQTYSVLPATIGSFTLNHQHVTIIQDNSAREAHDIWRKLMMDKGLIEDNVFYSMFVLQGEPPISLTSELEWFPETDWFFNALSIDAPPMLIHRFYPNNTRHITGFVFDNSIVEQLGTTFTYPQLKTVLQPYYKEELAHYMQYWQLLEQTKANNIIRGVENILNIPYIYSEKHTNRIYQEYMTQYGIIKSVDKEVSHHIR